MELKSGYKKTEVGIIPDDWEVHAAEEICTRIQDGTHFSPTLGGNDFLYVTSKNIGYGILDVSEADRIDEDQHNIIYRRCDVRKGDLLLTKDGANTGNAALNNLEEEFSLLSSVAFLRFDPQKYEPSLFLQQIISFNCQKQIKMLMTGNAITRLTLDKIRKLIFIVPPLPDQCAIAAALSDVDALIAALDRLIAKKRDIKRAAMQELLTGKRRLPGFSGEWKQTKFGDAFLFLRSANNSREDLTASEGIGYLHYGDIHTKWRTLLDLDSADLPKIAEWKVEGCPRLQDGDLIIADASEDYNGVGVAVEVQNIRKRAVVAGLHTLLLRERQLTFAPGFKGYIQYMPEVRSQLIMIATGVSVYSISKSNLADLSMPVPSLDEQNAITAILIDMDAEIAALENRRKKTLAMKQGMMQELLTGRIRLVQRGAA